MFINFGGQVEINDHEFWGALTFENCKFIKVSGTGCEDVNYGFKLSAQTCGLAFTEYSSDCEAEFIEINHTGFFGVYAKKDFGGTPPTPVPVFKNLVIHDTYVTNVAVGMYLGETKSPGMEFRHVSVFNNVVKHTKREGIQVANMVEDIEVYNNVLLDNGLDGEAGQGNNLQIGDNSVGKYYNNILKGAPGCGVIVFGAGDIEIFNNFLENNTGIFIDNRLFTRLYAPISIERNYFVNTKNNKVLLNYNEINLIVVKSNFYDGSCPFMLSNSSTQKNLECLNNQRIPISGISFSDTLKYIPGTGSLPTLSLGTVNSFTSFNSWPVLSTVEEQYIETGDTLKISLQASTLDGDKIEFQLDSLPNFAVVKDSLNGIKNISFYPKNSDTGKYEILITATEVSGRAKDRKVLNLTVAPGENHLPVMKFKPIEIYSLKYSVIPVHVSDLDHDKISLSLSGNPDFIHIECENDSIYNLVIEPGYTETGTYSFNFHLTDSYSEPIISGYSINVKPTKLIPNMPVYRLDCGGGIDIDIPGNELNWKHVRQSSGKEFVATSTWETGSGSYKGLNETSAPNNIFGSYSFDYSGGSEMQWKFPLTNGKYRVNLFFREQQSDIDFDGEKAVFDVDIEKTKELSNFCIFDENGENPLQKSFESVVRDHQLNIDFKQIAGKPKICGIEIVFLEAGNNPPVITKIGNIQINEGDTLKLPIQVTDDSDFKFSAATVSLLNSPKFAHIQFDNEKNSSEFIVEPDYFSASNYKNIKLKVNDGEFADSTVFSIVVNEKIRPNYPNFVLPDTLIIGEGETKTLSIVAFDPENDSFSVSFAGSRFVSLKSESGWNLEVKPGYYDSGNYKVYLTAKDQNNYTTKDSVLVIVKNVDAQIILHASMIKDEVVNGSSDSPNYLVDEQTLTPDNSGVPVSKSWKPATNSINAPFNCTIDLGAVYEISRISIHDMNNVGPLVVSTGKPLEWKELYTVQTDYYNSWKSSNVEVKSRYIRLTMNAGSAAFINEIVVYGTKSLEQPVESTPVTDTTTTNPLVVDQTIKQIVLNSQMIIDEVSGGSSDSPKYLVDEQDLNIDLKQHAVSKSWKPFYNSTKAPYNTTIDLGSEYVLKKICFHDMNNTGPMIISYGEPGKWQTLYIENFNTYNNWLSHAVDVTSRYLRLTIEAESGAYTNEMIVFGYQAPLIGLKKSTIIPTTNVEKPVEEIKVYPTRFSGSLNVSIGNDMTCTYRISLYNSNGKRLFEEIVSHFGYTNQTYSTDSWNLTSGLYILSVRNENTNQIKTFKVVKQ
ncbi:MAG: right-handed parallel beta-helix repeat-containing protein [Prolixibacteraceae bacterium]|nr:right-handed parallel beta-helix repeat-containing protein [Prolixibacteraceae bacterium]